MPALATIHQVWDSTDSAATDSFFASMANVRTYIAEQYDIPKSHVVLDEEGNWQGDYAEGTVYVRTLKIRLTARGICSAMGVYPNR